MSLLLALLSPAYPCGGFIPQDTVTRVVGSDAQQAFIELETETVTVTYRVRYSGDAEDFAWIIPVPGPVDSVSEGDEATFDELSLLTAPVVQWDNPENDDNDEDGSGGCACLTSSYSLSDKGVSRNDAGGLGDTGYQGGIVVTGEGFAGDFAYTTLEATGPNAMLGWLAENGYDSTVSREQIAAYENDVIGFSWIAVKLRPTTAQTPDGGVLLQPLKISYAAAADGNLHLLFPARMGAGSMLTEFRTEIYVLAPTRVEPGNGWGMGQNAESDDGFDIDGDETDDPQELFDVMIRSVGSQMALWPTYGNEWSDETGSLGYLSRYDIISQPSVNLADITFTQTEDADSAIRTLIHIPAVYYGDTALVIAPVGMVAMAWHLRRRRAR